LRQWPPTRSSAARNDICLPAVGDRALQTHSRRPRAAASPTRRRLKLNASLEYVEQTARSARRPRNASLKKARQTEKSALRLPTFLIQIFRPESSRKKRQGDKEMGDKEKGKMGVKISLSPCLPFSLSLLLPLPIGASI